MAALPALAQEGDAGEVERSGVVTPAVEQDGEVAGPQAAEGPAAAEAPPVAGERAAPAASPASSGGEPKAGVRVLVLDIEPGGLDPALVEAARDLITVALSEYEGLEVTSGEELRRALELEGEKAAVGCDDDGCLAEIAGALGAELVVFGRGARLGSVSVINLSLFDSASSRSVGRVTVELKEASELLAAVRPAVAQLFSEELQRRGLTAPASAVNGATVVSVDVTEEHTTPWLAWTVAGGGVALATLGGLVGLGTTGAFWLSNVENERDLADAEAAYRAPGASSDLRAAALGQAADLHDIHQTNVVLYYGAIAFTVGVVAAGLAVAAGGTAWALWPSGAE